MLRVSGAVSVQEHVLFRPESNKVESIRGYFRYKEFTNPERFQTGLDPFPLKVVSLLGFARPGTGSCLHPARCFRS